MRIVLGLVRRRLLRSRGEYGPGRAGYGSFSGDSRRRMSQRRCAEPVRATVRFRSDISLLPVERLPGRDGKRLADRRADNFSGDDNFDTPVLLTAFAGIV